MIAFDVYLIKPTKYDDEGYPVQWIRSVIPSNSLACLAGILDDSAARQALGPGVELIKHPIDETNTKVDVDAIISKSRTPGARTLVCLVGVQTNQFPRAMDIARPLRAAGVPVCIGGFHVSGCIAMLGERCEEIQLAYDLGVSMFAGEAEQNRFDEVLRDGFENRLKPLYNHLADMPSLQGAPIPLLAKDVVDRSVTGWSSFDLGRGCPFECSFCTIINVQGRKSRFRSADELEAIVRANLANGVSRFFVTDDNFARNRNWEAYCDRLIEMQETENIRIRMIIQVDAVAHKIPRFIDKAFRAGAHLIFVGLENINPDNLESVKKRQNRIEDYREMVLAWKKHPVVISCGYIIGFPNDTKASILRDVEILKRELPIDLLTLNMLTPLPGSEDHKTLRAAGVWMDPDFSKYDLKHRVTHHPRMSDREYEEAYVEAHRLYYSYDHIARIFKRMVQLRNGMRITTLAMLLAFREGFRLENVAFEEFGLFRTVRRRQRRHGMPIESPLVFYPREGWRFVRRTTLMFVSYVRMRLLLANAWKAWGRQDELPYFDESLASPTGQQDPLVAETLTRSTPYALKRQEKLGQRAPV